MWPEKFTSLELVQDLANTVRSGEGNASGVGNSWEDLVLGGAGGLYPLPEVLSHTC